MFQLLQFCLSCPAVKMCGESLEGVMTHLGFAILGFDALQFSSLDIVLLRSTLEGNLGFSKLLLQGAEGSRIRASTRNSTKQHDKCLT